MSIRPFKCPSLNPAVSAGPDTAFNGGIFLIPCILYFYLNISEKVSLWPNG